jgi:hypothetical protein
MNSRFGGWGRYGIALPFGVESRLRAEAEAQISAASRGERLSSIVGAGPSVTMLEAPAHGDGAALRAAYWLAVAARLTGDPRLISEAQRYYGMAGTGFWSSVPDIGTTLASAEAVARRAGRQEIAAVLNGMRRTNEVQAATSRWQPRDLLPWWLADPAQRRITAGSWVVGSTAVTLIAAAVVAAFLLVPSGTASAIGSTALGYARRRRSTVTRAGRKASRKSTRPKRISAAEASRRYMESSPWDDELE